MQMQHVNIPLVIVGVFLALGANLWMRQALGSYMEVDGMSLAFYCVASIGSYKDCPQIWPADMQDIVQHASVLFYIGVYLIVWGLFISRKTIPRSQV